MEFFGTTCLQAGVTGKKIDSVYKSYRWQVFLGIFYWLRRFFILCVRTFQWLSRNLASLVLKKGELSIVLSMNAVAYALSKFLMGSVSDRSNARVFLPLDWFWRLFP